MSHKLAQLTVNPKQKSSLVSKIFVSQPSAEEEQLVGRLFVLMEIDSSRSDEFAVADFIVREIYQRYYENEKFFLRDKISSLKIDYIFEAALTKLNAAIAAFLETERIAVPPGSLTLTIGVIHKNRLLFAQTGASRAMLLHRPKTKAGHELEYNLLDITEKTDDPTQEIGNPNKFFANVINGAIPARGYFFFANEAVLEYLSKKQILDIITTLPPAGAAEQIKNLLDQTNARVPFFGLIIKNTTGEDQTPLPYTSQAAAVEPLLSGGQSSVRDLNLTQETTERLLSPSGFITLKQWVNRLRPASSGLKTLARSTGKQFASAGERAKVTHRRLNLGRKTVDVITILARLVADATLSVFGLITEADRRRAALVSLRAAGRTAIRRLADGLGRLMRLPVKYKVIAAVILVCLVVLSISLITSNLARRDQASVARVEAAKTEFEQKQNQLEASLLYNNREGARQILDEMSALIAGLSESIERERIAQAELTASYHVLIDDIYDITRLDNPVRYAELPMSADALLAHEGRLYAPSGSGKTIMRMEAENSVAATSAEALSGGTVRFAGAIGSRLYLRDGSSILSYDSATDTITQVEIASKPDTVNAAAIYNNRLYLADEAGNQIYRFDLDVRTNDFGARLAWLREPTSLASAADMAINGQIFILAGNEIKLFSGGRAEPLTLDPVSPPLEEPRQILAPEASTLLYVLEPKHRRIIVYTSAGRYAAQYTSDAFDNLSALAVDESRRFLYVLNGSVIYKIEATHLDTPNE